MSSSVPAADTSLALVAFNDAWDLVDAGARVTLTLLDLQQSLGASWFDMQRSAFDLWAACWTWPGPASYLMRGTEQLA